MAISAEDLMRAMDEFVGGSDERTRHALNRRFIYTAGFKEVAEKAEAYWLLDLIALQMAPIYAKAWKQGKAGIGIVTLEVFDRAAGPGSGPGGAGATGALTVGAVLAAKQRKSTAAAQVTLSLEDDTQAAFEHDIGFTDFPVGKWVFYLGTDEVGPDEYVTTVCLPQEY